MICQTFYYVINLTKLVSHSHFTDNYFRFTIYWMEQTTTYNIPSVVAQGGLGKVESMQTLPLPQDGTHKYHFFFYEDKYQFHSHFASFCI
uniref:Putative ovule protein n=1 Tax=Solanum chacoense TaxID=4108 RepID=A0A0V0GP13_SOLCH